VFGRLCAWTIFEAKALRTLRVDREKDKDLSVELN